MSANFVVSSLPAYVADNHDLLVKNFALVGGATRPRMSVQTGIKYKEHINYLNLAPTLQSGASCGFEAAGEATLTQREIECPSIKVNMDICPRSLVGKYAEYLVRNNANAESLPFEAYIMEGITNEINKKMEKLIWQGDKSSSSTDIKWFDGLLKIAGADSSVVDVTIAGTSAYTDIKAVYAAMTEETLDKGGVIFVSPAKFRQFMQELVTANLFHYDPRNEEPTEFLLPGSDVKVVRTPGLAGSTSIVGTFAANLIYGCDMEGDSEDIKVWFSDDDDVFKLKALWNAGVQIAFPDQVVLGATA